MLIFLVTPLLQATPPHQLHSLVVSTYRVIGHETMPLLPLNPHELMIKLLTQATIAGSHSQEINSKADLIILDRLQAKAIAIWSHQGDQKLVPYL